MILMIAITKMMAANTGIKVCNIVKNLSFFVLWAFCPYVNKGESKRILVLKKFNFFKIDKFFTKKPRFCDF